MDGIIISVLWIAILVAITYQILVPRALCLLGRHSDELLLRLRRKPMWIIVSGCMTCRRRNDVVYTDEEMSAYTEKYRLNWTTASEEKKHYAHAVYNVGNE